MTVDGGEEESGVRMGNQPLTGQITTGKSAAATMSRQMGSKNVYVINIERPCGALATEIAGKRDFTGMQFPSRD